MQAAEGRACVIAVNKWDTIALKTDKTLADYEADVRAQVGDARLLCFLNSACR
jgi:predicted GTPase